MSLEKTEPDRSTEADGVASESMDTKEADNSNFEGFDTEYQEVVDENNPKTPELKSIKKKMGKVKNSSDMTRQALTSSVPLSIRMPFASRKALNIPNFAHNGRSQSSSIQRRKGKCSGRGSSVPPSMVFKTSNFGTVSAKVISADGEWLNFSREVNATSNEDEQSDLRAFCIEEYGPEIDIDNHPTNSSAEFHFLFGNVILHLKHPTSFPFCGQIQVEVIKGAVEILGYKLTPAKGSQTVFSPRGSSLLPIQTIEIEEDDLCNVSCMDLHASELSSLFEKGGIHDAWLYLKKVDSILPSFLDRYMPLKLFPSAAMIERDRIFPRAARKLNCLFDLPQGFKCFERGDEWDLLHDHVLESGCTVLCGGKGVGKSTMLRFLVNQLLNSSKGHVVLLDFDPGQAELTVPGCVSISVVTRPLLGPNFTHLQRPTKCFYIGEVNVSNCVTRYMDACVSLINLWRSDSSFDGLPCIVNTMGFTQGLGVTLMVQLLSILKPNLVVQIGSTKASHNYPELLTVDYVKRNCFTSPFTSDVDAQLFTLGVRPVCSSSINYNLLSLTAVTENCRDKTLGPRQLRDIVILSYFSQAITLPSHSLLDVVPFSCPLDSLYICVSHVTVEPSLILSTINSSLVALCNIVPPDEDYVQVSSIGVPMVLSRPVTANCVGFGFVRGIDMDTKYLYLSTPLKSNELSSVNCIMLGAINLPSAVYLHPPKEAGPVPYVAVIHSGAMDD